MGVLWTCSRGTPVFLEQGIAHSTKQATAEADRCPGLCMRTPVEEEVSGRMGLWAVLTWTGGSSIVAPHVTGVWA